MTRFFERTTEPKGKWEKKFFTKGHAYVEISQDNYDFYFINESEMQPDDIVISDNQGQHIVSTWYLETNFKEVM